MDNEIKIKFKNYKEYIEFRAKLEMKYNYKRNYVKGNFKYVVYNKHNFFQRNSGYIIGGSIGFIISISIAFLRSL